MEKEQEEKLEQLKRNHPGLNKLLDGIDLSKKEIFIQGEKEETIDALNKVFEEEK